MAGFDPSLQPTESRAHLLTEQSNDRSSRLDQLDTAALVHLFVEEDRRPQQAVSAAADALARAVDGIVERLLLDTDRGRVRLGRCGRLDGQRRQFHHCRRAVLRRGTAAEPAHQYRRPRHETRAPKPCRHHRRTPEPVILERLTHGRGGGTRLARRVE